jgi:hypothetical protein
MVNRNNLLEDQNTMKNIGADYVNTEFICKEKKHKNKTLCFV